MPSKKDAPLNSRKPFKLLAGLASGELKKIQIDLRTRSEYSSGKLFKKLSTCFEQWKRLNFKKNRVTHAQFIAKTALPSGSNAFDKLISAFYTYLQEFLAREVVGQDPALVQHLAFRAYRKASFPWKEVRRRHQEAHRELDKLPQSSNLLNYRMIVDLDLATKANARSIPTEERGYRELLDSLEANYVTQKLRLLCAIANDEQIFMAMSAESDLSGNLPDFNPNWPLMARLYYQFYLVLSNRQQDYSMANLQELLDSLDVKSPTYPWSDMMDLYGYLMNSLARKINRGDPHALSHLSQLYDHLIEKEILLSEGMISAEHLKNIINVKLKLSDVAGARDTFEKLKNRISNDPDQNAASYNNCLILYAEGHLREAEKQLEALSNQTGNLKLDQFYGLDLRYNLLKVYFDLLEREVDDIELWDQIEEKMARLLQSFRGYIERRNLPEQHRRNYESFRRLMQVLYDYSFQKGTESSLKDLEETVREIQDSTASVDSWVKKRLDKILSHPS